MNVGTSIFNFFKSNWSLTFTAYAGTCVTYLFMYIIVLQNLSLTSVFGKIIECNKYGRQVKEQFVGGLKGSFHSICPKFCQFALE